MGYMSRFCTRLKNLFFWDKWRRSKTRYTASTLPPDRVLATIQANPFALIDEDTRIIVNLDKQEVMKTRIVKGSRIRKILYFSSNSEELSPGNELSITVSPKEEPEKCLDTNRYQMEFLQLDLVGTREFGSVFRCLNRLDGCCYAVKRSKSLVINSFAHQRACKEVHANAALNNHSHIVRYFSAWLEDDCMFIQQEYCNGGDLLTLITRMKCERKIFKEKELLVLLLQVAQAIIYIYRMKLVHMDIKPNNIFICKYRVWTSQEQGDSKYFDDFIDNNYIEKVSYKIGDLDHVISIADAQNLEEKVTAEILREDFRDLTIADIFSLGLTIYETGGGGPFPKNGSAWHNIKNGNLKKLTQYSDQFNDFLKIMIHPNPENRPSAAYIVQNYTLPNKNSVKNIEYIVA